MTRIRVTWPTGEVVACLADTPSARAVLAALPTRARARTWGEELYFSLPASVALEPDARDVVEPGTVCYWVEGQSLALPFGPTPVSHQGECRLVTAVNVLGRIEGDPRALATVRDGDPVEVRLA